MWKQTIDTGRPIILSAGGTPDLSVVCSRRRIGGGSFGTVFGIKNITLDEWTNTPVPDLAIKIYKSACSDDAISEYRVHRKLSLIGGFSASGVSLETPCMEKFKEISGIPYLGLSVVVALRYLHEYDNIPAIIMPKYARAASTHCFTPLDLVRYAGQMTTALEYVHGLRVVHGDINLTNVCMTRDRDFVLIDFGLASDMPESLPATYSDTYKTELEESVKSHPYFSVDPGRGFGATPRSDFEMLAYSILYAMIGTNSAVPRAIFGPLESEQTIWERKVFCFPSYSGMGLSSELALKCSTRLCDAAFSLAESHPIALERCCASTWVQPFIEYVWRMHYGGAVDYITLRAIAQDQLVPEYMAIDEPLRAFPLLCCVAVQVGVALGLSKDAVTPRVYECTHALFSWLDEAGNDNPFFVFEKWMSLQCRADTFISCIVHNYHSTANPVSFMYEFVPKLTTYQAKYAAAVETV